jgi:hypothetical protein
MNADEAFQRVCRDLLAMRNQVSGTVDVNASTYALLRLARHHRSSTGRSGWWCRSAGIRRLRSTHSKDSRWQVPHPGLGLRARLTTTVLSCGATRLEYLT